MTGAHLINSKSSDIRHLLFLHDCRRVPRPREFFQPVPSGFNFVQISYWVEKDMS